METLEERRDWIQERTEYRKTEYMNALSDLMEIEVAIEYRRATDVDR